jgi:hypothetical protein
MKRYKIESRVSAREFYAQKIRREERILYDDFAVLDPGDGWRILARGSRMDTVGKSIDAMAELTEAGWHLLQTVSLDAAELPILIPCRRGTLLVYGAWLRAVGVVPVIRIDQTPQTVKKAYVRAKEKLLLHGEDFSLLNDDQMWEDLSVRLYGISLFAKRMFARDTFCNVYARLLLIANFVGCRLNAVSVPPREIRMSESDVQTLCAYLLCTFLTLRGYSGDVSALGKFDGSDDYEESPVDALLGRMNVTNEYDLWIRQSLQPAALRGTERRAERDLSRLISFPAFRDFRLICDGRSLNLCIPVRQKSGIGFSHLDPRVTYLQIDLLPRTWQEEAETSELPEE